MKIVCISDTHLRHNYLKMPDGDILIHAGDALGHGTLPEMAVFANWFNSLEQYKYKIYVPGNHDWICLNNPSIAQALIESTPNTRLLIDRQISVEGLNIYGSPWQPEYCNWAFNLPRGEPLARVWANIPTNTDILVTHGPPANILDYIPTSHVSGEHVGCRDLRNEIFYRVMPRLHIFGHIHYSHGMHKQEVSKNSKNHTIQFINAACCDEDNFLVHQPTVLEI